MTGFASRVLLLAVLLAFPFVAAAEEKKVAMVVGNAAYAATTPLANTVNDARAIAESLTRLGFEVHAAYDATQSELLEAFGHFSEALDGADAAVFYYAGHGIQIDNENYILPVDIKVESEMSVRYSSLSLTDVLQDVERRSRVAIVILDACRDNPLADLIADDVTRSTGATRGLAPMKPSGNGAIIAYAAAPGQVASDGADGHSPYTSALLAEMEKPGVEVGLIFRRVAGRVIEQTGGVQRPEILVRLAAEYYLSSLPATLVAETPAAAAPATSPPVDAAPAQPVAVAAVGEAELRQAVDASGDRAALWDYAATLQVSPLDPPTAPWVMPPKLVVAEIEPNNSFGMAQPLEANAEVSVAIAPAGDNDWVRFLVMQGGRLTVQAPKTPPEIDLAVRLVNANGDEVAYWIVAPRPGGELLAEYDLARPGVYFLQFADSNNDATAAATFSVTLGFEPVADLHEPNDRIDLAKHIALDGTFPINLLPRGEHDFFKLTAPSPGSLIVSMTDAPKTIDAAFRLLDGNGTEMQYWLVAPRPGGDNVAVVDLPRPGVYYLDVADSGGDGSDIAPLSFSTRFVASPDLLEPNDNLAQAIPIEATSTQTMAIFPARDSDWLELAIVQPGELTLEVQSPPENLLLSWRVLDGNGAEVQYWSPAARPGGDLFGTFDVARPGRYYLQLAASDAATSSVEPFELDLSFKASLDAFEPNDTIGSARPLTPGGEVPFTMLPRGDNDWFRVTVDQPGELALQIDEGPENLDINYRVVNSDWSELAYWVPPYRKGGLTEGFVDLPRPGTYFLQIADGAYDGRSIEPATLRTAFSPTLGSNEPNNAFGEATPVEITGETVAHILPLGDGDWHVFHADGPGELDVAIDGVPENLDIAFRLLNADRAEIQYWVSAPRPGGLTSGTVAIPAAGWYWMEIRDGNNNARSPLPFTVTRTFRPMG